MDFMKKLLTLALTGCMLLCSFSAFATAENIVIDGETVTIPSDMGKICEKDDRTFVPVRFLTEYLGCVVRYGEVQQSATITNPNTGISYFLVADGGDLSDKLFVLSSNGSEPVITMDTKMFINNEEGRMYIPIRYIAEAIGYEVSWDEETQTVGLTSIQNDTAE